MRWLAASVALLALGCPARPTGGDDDDDNAGGDDDTANEPPSASILLPLNGSTVDSPVDLSGAGYDDEDGDLPGEALLWSSNVDGELGTGNALSVALSSGLHTVRLTVTDSDGLSASAMVQVTVEDGENTAPQAFIDVPADETYLLEGDSLTLEGHADDAQDGSIPGAALFWSSSLDGALGSGASVPLIAPTLGDHTIVLTAIDSGGLSGVASTMLHVVPIGSNLPPAVTINTPSDNASFSVGDTVSFQGGGTDPEDGPLTGTSLLWSSSLDGALGTGGSLSISTLTQGVHAISLTGTDGDGDSDTDTITISVNPAGNDAPVVTITNPPAGATYNAGNPVPLAGSATDTEDGALTGAALAWSSSLDGALGTGASLSVTSLSAGGHTLTLTATDSGGATGTATRSITVLQPNSAPTVTITAPPNNSNYTAGDSITFTGTANDAEDGPLTGASLVWSSSVSGPFGTGTSVTTASLPAATHTITLSAVDSGGLPGSASRTIVIAPAPVNLPPTALLSVPPTGLTGISVAFDGSGSSDADGSIVDYEFDPGDGSSPIGGAQASVPFTYTTAGSFTVTLTVTDDDGASDTATASIEIVEPIPVPVVVYTAGDLGTICDIALDAADNAYVVFRDDLHSQLVYGTDASGSWVFEVADGPGFDTGGSVEANMAIAVTPAGVPHVAYGYSNNEQVRWATRAANGTWTREQANPSWGDNTGYAFDIALDPSASYRPTIVYSYDLGTPEEVRLTYRTGAGAWTNVAYATGGDYDYALGGIAFTSSGTAWIPYDIYTTQAVTWTAAGGFTGAVTLDASSGTTRGKVVVDTLGQPIVATGYGTYHRVGTSWIESAYESFVATGFDPAINAAGDFGLGVIHAGGLELLYPDPYYSYEYQGPADGTAMAAAMDSTGRLRACFFRNDQLLVY